MPAWSICRGTVVLASLLLAGPGCAPHWSSALLANSEQVARALGDSVELRASFDPASVPDIDPPTRLRPCCAFGQDLRAKLGPVPVPFFEQENILSPREVGPHGYDKGDLKREHNGLLYTCRGGFIDLAHVRDNADRTLYLAMQIARALPGGLTLELPEEGTLRRLRLQALPPGLLAREGRWTTATAIASWVNYQLSIWHEVVTWYGWESIPGISERVSAFSPEDMYSNVLGTNLAAGIITNREARSRDQYDESMEAWIGEALRRLGAVDKAHARAAMAAVDGLWWDSSKRVPDWKLVTRRYVDIDPPLSGWLVARALAQDGDSRVARMCRGQPPPLSLRVPQRIGNIDIAELATVELEFAGWLPKQFPLPAKQGDLVTQAEFAAIVADIRRAGAEQLGPGFDRPGVVKQAGAGPAKR